MNPAEMSDAELSDSIAREVYGMQFSERYGFWMNADGSGGMSPLTWSPSTDDAQALAAFDRAAELVGAHSTEYSWDEAGEFAAIRWRTESALALTRVSRARSLSEAALSAIRAWREKGGAT